MKIKVGDNVRVITGSNKGKEGKVLKVLRSESKVLVDGINMVKKQQLNSFNNLVASNNSLKKPQNSKEH